uniref:Uncharacterized protein n=1 Tax=Taxus floridana TaxID=156270 RepID=A0A481XBL7_9CONI|nr:hypothetical protein Ycf2 [Taxus floridana]
MKQKKTYLEKYPTNPNEIPNIFVSTKYRFYSIYCVFKVRLMGVFNPWTESNLVRLLTNIFSGRESVIKLFDFRIISTLFIRDIRLFILRGQAIKALIILTLPLVFYYLNSRSLFETNRSKYNAMTIFPSIYQMGSQNLLLLPHVLMSLPKDKRRYERRLLHPREHAWFSINPEISDYYKKKVMEWQIEDPNQEEESVGTRPSRKPLKLSPIEKRIKKFVELTKEIEEEEFTKEIEHEELTEKVTEELTKEITQLTEEISLQSEFSKGLIDNLSIDESYINISPTIKKPIDIDQFKLIKRRKDAYEYFHRSEKNRRADLWKVKTYLQNRSANYDISSDPGSNIRRDINRFNCIRFVNQSLPSIYCSSCVKNKEQLTLNNDFNFKKIVLKIVDQFTQSITKPNQVYDYEIACDMLYHNMNLYYNMNKFYELNNKILLNKTLKFNMIFNYRDKLKDNSFFVLLNILDKKNEYVDKITAYSYRTETSVRLILNQYKVKIKNYFQKRFKRFYLLNNAFMKRILNSLHKIDNYLHLQKIFNRFYLYLLNNAFMKRILNSLHKIDNYLYLYLQIQKIFYLLKNAFMKIILKSLHKIKNSLYLEIQIILIYLDQIKNSLYLQIKIILIYLDQIKNSLYLQIKIILIYLDEIKNSLYLQIKIIINSLHKIYNYLYLQIKRILNSLHKIDNYLYLYLQIKKILYLLKNAFVKISLKYLHKIKNSLYLEIQLFLIYLDQIKSFHKIKNSLYLEIQLFLISLDEINNSLYLEIQIILNSLYLEIQLILNSLYLEIQIILISLDEIKNSLYLQIQIILNSLHKIYNYLYLQIQKILYLLNNAFMKRILNSLHKIDNYLHLQKRIKIFYLLSNKFMKKINNKNFLRLKKKVKRSYYRFSWFSKASMKIINIKDYLQKCKIFYLLKNVFYLLKNVSMNLIVNYLTKIIYNFLTKIIYNFLPTRIYNFLTIVIYNYLPNIIYNCLPTRIYNLFPKKLNRSSSFGFYLFKDAVFKLIDSNVFCQNKIKLLYFLKNVYMIIINILNYLHKIKNSLYLQIQKIFKIFYLLKNAFMERILNSLHKIKNSLKKIYNRFWFIFYYSCYREIYIVNKAYKKYKSLLKKTYKKYRLLYNLDYIFPCDLESYDYAGVELYLEWNELWKETERKYCFEWKKVTNRFHQPILQMTRVYYQQKFKFIHKYNFEWKKRFSRNLKDQIRTNWIKKDILNNVTQDAINQHSSSWRIYQEEWFNHFIIRASRNINRNLNISASSIQIEYLKKELKRLVFCSKQNNLKNIVFDPIELFTIKYFGQYGKFDPIELSTHNNSNFDWYQTTKKLFGIILDELAPLERDIESKSIPSQKSESLIDEEAIASLGLNDKPMNESIIDLFDNEKNYMEFFDNTGISRIFNNRDNWLNPLKLSNKNSLRTTFFKANTFEFLDYLHHPSVYYKERLASYIERERIHIKNKSITYGKLLNFVPTHNNPSSFSIYEIGPVLSEKDTISLIKSHVNILLAKYLRDQALIHDLYKSFNLLTQLNSFIHNKIHIGSIQDIYRIPLISKQIVNLDKSYCYPFAKSSDSEENNPFFKSLFDPVFNSSIKSYKDDLLSEISFRMKKFAEKEKYSSAESSKNIIEDKVIGDKDAFLDLFNKEILKIKNILFYFYKIPQIQIDIFEKWDLFQPYTSWFFTSTGWKYMKKSFLATFPERLETSNYQLISFLDDIRKDCNHNLNIMWTLYHQFWTLIKWKFRFKFLPKWNLFLSFWNLLDWKEPINQTVLRGKDTSVSFDTWKYILNVREYDKPLYIFLGFFFFVSCTIFSWLKLVINVYIFNDFRTNMGRHYYLDLKEKMKSFKKLRIYYNLNWYGFWLTFIDFVDQVSDPDDVGLLAIFEILHVKSNLKWLLRRSNKWHSLLKMWLYEYDGTEELLSREKVLFSVQERISKFESKLTPPNGFFSKYFEKGRHPGLRYLRYLAEIIQLGLINKIGIRDCELDSLFLAEKRVFDVFQHQINSLPTKRSLSDQVIFFPFYPALSLSNRILLIGPKDTGRSYLAKSLAADSYLPLIKISPKSFLDQEKLLITNVAEYTSAASKSYLEHADIFFSMGWSRPEDIYDKAHYQQKPKNWYYQRDENDVSPEFFSRRYAQFVLALQLAKLMSPCVIWIPDIHEMDDFVFHTTVLGELLGDPPLMDEDEEESIQQNIVVIASTHIPKKLDPFLISPPYRKRRFDTFINTKMCPASHREKEFTLLLRDKGLYLKKEWNSDNFFGLMTSGFNTRDMAKLANYVWRLGIILNTSVIDDDITGYALYRSRWACSNYDFYSGTLPYKIGKAIIQNKLTYPKHFLDLKREFLSARAYFLFEWYLEPSIAGTAVKELTIFYHIVGCLAGSVAQDCWFTSESNRENWTPLSDIIANDFTLASNLLQSLLEEFPGGEIFRGNYDKNNITIAPYFKRDMMQKGLSAQLDELVLFKELKYSYIGELGSRLVCSPRTWRFTFLRSNRFDHKKDITLENHFLDYLRLFGEFQKRPTRLSSFFWVKFLASRDPIDIYQDSKNVPRRKIAAFWEARSLYNKFQRLGIYKFDTEEDATEYKPLDTPIIYFGRRFLWDPVSIRFQNKHVAFLRADLFVPRELVKRIYITYALERKEVLRDVTIITIQSISKRKKIRNIALGLKYQIVEDDDNDNSDLPPTIKKKKREDFETFKRFQEVGVRLRRVLPYPTKILDDAIFREKTRDDKFRVFLVENERENRELLYNECFIHNTLSEIYEYLANMFISNTMLLKQIENELFKQEWLSPDYINSLVTKGLKKKI